MVSDIQQLQKVIHSLEEESSRVSQFNGVLDRIESAKSEIVFAKDALADLCKKHGEVATEIASSFEGNSERLCALEAKLVSLEQNQKRMLDGLSDLDVLTPRQFEDGISSVRSFVEELIAQSDLRRERDALAEANSTKSLRTLGLASLSVLLFGIALLIYGVYF